MLAIVVPGQGAQTPGMLSTWLQDSQSRDLLTNWSEAISVDLIHLGTKADAEEIKDTANAQPLIVATSLIAFHALSIRNFSVVSGHSVGELAAAAISEVLSPIDALTFVRARGFEMAKAAAIHSTGMSAVLGGNRADVVAALESLGLVAANENGAGQIIAAGELNALEVLAENPPAGARVRALAVAGAFHTSFMESAVQPLRDLSNGIKTLNPSIGVISNRDGAVINDGSEVLARIINQIASPVRWDLCMDTLKNIGVTGVIELAPAGTLIGLLKRAVPEIEGFALKSADDLSAAREFAERHV